MREVRRLLRPERDRVPARRRASRGEAGDARELHVARADRRRSATRNSSGCPAGDDARRDRRASAAALRRDAAEQRLERLRLAATSTRRGRARTASSSARAATGAPSRPSNETRTSRDVACASSPPTTLRPCGHVSRYVAVAVRGHDDPRARDADARLDAVALVRRAARRRERRGDRERGDERERERPHGILRNQMPESRPPASMNAMPPAAAAAVTSTVFFRLPAREPSSS